MTTLKSSSNDFISRSKVSHLNRFLSAKPIGQISFVPAFYVSYQERIYRVTGLVQGPALSTFVPKYSYMMSLVSIDSSDSLQTSQSFTDDQLIANIYTMSELEANFPEVLI